VWARTKGGREAQGMWPVLCRSHTPTMADGREKTLKLSSRPNAVCHRKRPWQVSFIRRSPEFERRNAMVRWAANRKPPIPWASAECGKRRG
jgi:hypothetical protein